MPMMYNPCHPGEILREYIGSMPVGEAAQGRPVHALAPVERPGLVHSGHGAAPLGRLWD
jgi:hypothetical protein